MQAGGEDEAHDNYRESDVYQGASAVISTMRLPATEEVLREELVVKLPLVAAEQDRPGLRGCEDLMRGSSGVRRVGEESSNLSCCVAWSDDRH